MRALTWGRRCIEVMLVALVGACSSDAPGASGQAVQAGALPASGSAADSGTSAGVRPEPGAGAAAGVTGAAGGRSSAAGTGARIDPGAGSVPKGGAYGAANGGSASGGVGAPPAANGGVGANGGGAGVAGTAIAGSAAGRSAPEHPAPWRIMPLGDSITQGTCTTQLLFAQLRAAGHAHFDLVGTLRNNESCDVADADRDCEGHSGYYATDLVDMRQHASELLQWCNADRADVVLMHLGTNDLWHANIAPDVILSAFSKIVAALRAVQPNVIVFVAQIIPMTPSDCSDCAGRVQAFNAQIPAWAASESAGASPLYVVDQWSGFDAAADTGDGVHPNRSGSQKMAMRWAEALGEHGLF